MKDRLKDNVCGADACQQRKPYFAPCVEIVDVECGVSLLAGSGGDVPQPTVDDDDSDWADDDSGML